MCWLSGCGARGGHGERERERAGSDFLQGSARGGRGTSVGACPARAHSASSAQSYSRLTTQPNALTLPVCSLRIRAHTQPRLSVWCPLQNECSEGPLPSSTWAPTLAHSTHVDSLLPPSLLRATDCPSVSSWQPQPG